MPTMWKVDISRNKVYSIKKGVMLFIVIIKPKETNKKIKMIKEAFQDKINPQKSVSKIKYIKNWGVAISFDENEVVKIRKQAEINLRPQGNVVRKTLSLNYFIKLKPNYFL